MLAMVRKARMRERSGLEPRFCQRPREEERNSPWAPLGLAMTVERPPSVRRGLVGPPTRTGSLSEDSLAKVLHSEVSSTECASSTSPHSVHTVSPAEWSNATSVCFLQSGQNESLISPPLLYTSSPLPSLLLALDSKLLRDSKVGREALGVLHNADSLSFSSVQRRHPSAFSCTESLGKSVRSPDYPSAVKSIFEDLNTVKKILMFTSCSSAFGASSIWRQLHLVDKLGNMHSVHLYNMYSVQTEKIENSEASKNSEIALGSMSTEMDGVSTSLDNKEHCYDGNDTHGSQTRNTPTKLSTISNEEVDTHPFQNPLEDTNSNPQMFQQDSKSLASACSFQQMMTREAMVMSTDNISDTVCTHVPLKQKCSSCLMGEPVIENSSNSDHKYAYRNDRYQQHLIDECSPDFEPSLQRRFHSAITMNRHAVAGALAGTVVSLCLHPVDTVKTIIQATNYGHNSFSDTLRRTITERGMLGLYGGIASKIVSSAPISAIYTLTYESVKGALLPVLPKEYHAVAHCVAGGCSSIATSIVFTPSECIKQQMQVGSQYQNCWNALIGCLKKGGFASLYAGWGAVLCRNIPHSIVKFYAYESLKQYMLKAAPADAKLDSCQTLVCGGFAGSTAALFTTPFDVVKTRIQIQALRPVSNYQGVLHALKEIFRQEGLQGLYRGLTARLAIYISQGAIFFASYEFLKTILFPEQKRPAIAFDSEKKMERQH